MRRRWPSTSGDGERRPVARRRARADPGRATRRARRHAGGRAAAAAAGPASCCAGVGSSRSTRRSTCSGRSSRRATRRPRCTTTSSGSGAACPTGVIESAGDGYRLEPSRIDLDADRLAAALSRRRSGRPGGPGRRSTPCSARWHGPAYPELDDVDDGRAESIRLDELRIRAVEARAERRLAAGDTDGLVAELAALADEEPLRERPRALLMAALAAAGRQVEALRVYDDFRRRLGDELGIEPSPVAGRPARRAARRHGRARRGRRRAGCRFRRPRWSVATRSSAEVTAMVEAAPAGDAGRPGRCGQDPPARRGRPPAAGRATPIGRWCCASWRRPTRSRRSMSSPRRWDRRPAGRRRSSSGWPPSSATPRSCCCSTTASTSSTRSPSWWNVSLAACPDVTVVATSRERLRVPGEQLLRRADAADAADDGDDAPAVRAVRRAGAGRGARASSRTPASWR